MIKRYCNRCEREVDCNVYNDKGELLDRIKSKNADEVLAFAGLKKGVQYDTCPACAKELETAIVNWKYRR